MPKNKVKTDKSIEKNSYFEFFSLQINRYAFPTTAGGKGEPLQAETLYSELKELKVRFNEIKEENWKMRARIATLEVYFIYNIFFF